MNLLEKIQLSLIVLFCICVLIMLIAKIEIRRLDRKLSKPSYTPPPVPAKPSNRFAHMNHYHEPTDQHEIITLGGETFIANKKAVPLLKALHDVGLKTRTHHIDHRPNAFISILLDDSIQLQVKRVYEADRTKYNGRKELLIMWDKPEIKGPSSVTT